MRVKSIGLIPATYGTHSVRRTKAALIYRKTGNLRAVQLLLGHTKLESTVRYLGVEVDDALTISEQVDLRCSLGMTGTLRPGHSITRLDMARFGEAHRFLSSWRTAGLEKAGHSRPPGRSRDRGKLTQGGHLAVSLVALLDMSRALREGDIGDLLLANQSKPTCSLARNRLRMTLFSRIKINYESVRAGNPRWLI